MNILFVSNTDPRVKNTGSEQRTNLLWKCLQQYGRVFSYYADQYMNCNEELTDGDYPIYRFRPTKRTLSIWRPLHSLLENLSVFSILRYKKYRYPDPCTVFGGCNFDLVVVRYVGTACFYKYWNIAPMLIDIDDYPLQVYHTIKGVKRGYLFRELGAWITKKQTDYIISKTADCWIANSSQLNIGRHHFCYLPNISNEPSDSYDSSYLNRKGLFTVGNMSYGPNYLGVDKFLTSIWPAFHKKYPDVIYQIAGKGAPDVYSTRWKSYEGVEYLGFVDDIEILYKECLATVVPIYGGGGTCIKTLESLSHSRTCISTPFGLRGLPENIIDGKHGLIVFNNADDFIQAYEFLLHSEDKYYYEREGRYYFLTNHSLKIFEQAVYQLIIRHINKTS